MSRRANTATSRTPVSAQQHFAIREIYRRCRRRATRENFVRQATSTVLMFVLLTAQAPSFGRTTSGERPQAERIQRAISAFGLAWLQLLHKLGLSASAATQTGEETMPGQDEPPRPVRQPIIPTPSRAELESRVARLVASNLVETVAGTDTTGNNSAGVMSASPSSESQSSALPQPSQPLVLTMRPGQSRSLLVVPEDAEGNAVQGFAPDWSSSAVNVVSISSDGVAMAHATGAAVLTARANSQTLAVSVTVVDTPDPEELQQALATSERPGVKSSDGGPHFASAVSPSSSSEIGVFSPGVISRNQLTEKRRVHGKNASSGAIKHSVKGSSVRSMPANESDAAPTPGSKAAAEGAAEAGTPSAAVAPARTMLLSGIPDSETPWLFRPENEVGMPPGRTEPGAVTPPAAVAGTEMPLSSNYFFSIPLVSLPGRSGLDASLALNYNSRLWNRSPTGNKVTFDVDNGWPAPGFRLGWGYLDWQNDGTTAGHVLVDADGTRHRLAPITSTSDTRDFETIDGTFIHFQDEVGTGGKVTYSDGTSIRFDVAGADGFRYPSIVTDRNGNQMQVSYVINGVPNIATIKDSLERYIIFKYAIIGGDLVAITAPAYNNGSTATQVVRFYYETMSLNGTFSSPVTTKVAPTSFRALRYIYFPGTRSGYSFRYSGTGGVAPYGVIDRIAKRASMAVSTTSLTESGTVTNTGNDLAVTTYNYPTTPSSLNDVPAFTRRTDDWAGRTTGMGGVPATAPYHTFSVDKAAGTYNILAPDNSKLEVTTTVNAGAWDDGLVIQTLFKDSGGTTARSKTVTTWESESSTSFRNHRPKKVAVTLDDKTQTTEFEYGAYNNTSKIIEHDFDTAPNTPGATLRTTEMSYETDTAYLVKRLVSLPKTVKIYAGASATLTARTDITYDEGTPESYSDIVMYTSPGGIQRGNVTKVRAYADPVALSGGTTDMAIYDIAGNVRTQSTACCRQIEYIYTSTTKYAYPETVKRGDPNASPPLTLTSSITYDLNTGLPRTLTDPNGHETNYQNETQTLRIEIISRPDTGDSFMTYEDDLVVNPNSGRMNNYVKTEADIATGDVDIDYIYTDGRGATQRILRDDTRGATAGSTNGYSATDIEYDVMGRAYRTSNPYFADDKSTPINPTGLWTTVTGRDSLGRTTETTFTDGTKVTVVYSGNTITATDQAGKPRRSITDALGRMSEVHEPDATLSLGTVAAPVQPSKYTYNVLNNLVKIQQTAGANTQNRYFNYDGLGRLTYERQVEMSAPHSATDTLTGNNSWSRKMTYDARGLVATVTDARSISKTFTYDALNRVTDINYSDSTPDVTMTYDEARTGAFNLGRLTTATTAAVGTSIPQIVQKLDYHKMGMVKKQTQQIGTTATYVTSYTFNMAGQMTGMIYPDARELTQSFDEAGRLVGIAETVPGSQAFVSGIKYRPHGGMEEETWGAAGGSSPVHAMAYNPRLQVSQIKVAVGGTDAQRYDYSYGTMNMTTGAPDGTKNNGQIALIESFIGTTKQWSQRHAYDQLGRVDLVAQYNAAPTPVLTHRSDFNYDRFGNRFQPASGSANYNLRYIPVETSEISATTNRYTTSGAASIGYDANGNVTSDLKFRYALYDYDAENRVTEAADGDDQGKGTSVYDAFGQRVLTTIGTEWRHFVYGAGGQVIAEYGPDGWERDRVYRGAEMIATVEAIGNCRKTIKQFVQAIYWGALNRQPSSSEATSAVNSLTTAQGQGQAQLKTQAVALAHSLFTSTEYANRNSLDPTTHPNADREFIHDLYWAYLQRAPEEDGYAFWLNEIATCRATTGCVPKTFMLQEFDDSDEFTAVLQQLCAGTLQTKTLWQMTDHTGSVRLLMNSNGVVVARHDYVPFGDELEGDFPRPGMLTSGPQGVPLEMAVGDTTTGLDNWRNTIRSRFAQMEKDAATGLEHTQFRKYDSWQGRWTSPDPYSGSMRLSDPQSINRYAYVENDPVNFTDPTGLVLVPIFGQACTYSGSSTFCETYITGYVETGVNGGNVVPQNPYGPPGNTGPGGGGNGQSGGNDGKGPQNPPKKPCQVSTPDFATLKSDPRLAAAYDLFSRRFGSEAERYWGNWGNNFRGAFLNATIAANAAGVATGKARYESILSSDKDNKAYGITVSGITTSDLGTLEFFRPDGSYRSPSSIPEGSVEASFIGKGPLQGNFSLDVDLKNPNGNFGPHAKEVINNLLNQQSTNELDAARSLQKRGVYTGVDCK